MLFFCDKIKSDLRVLSRSFRNRNFNLLIILFSSISFLPQKEFYFSLTTLFLSTEKIINSQLFPFLPLFFPQGKLQSTNYANIFPSLFLRIPFHRSDTIPFHSSSQRIFYSVDYSFPPISLTISIPIH